MNNELLEESRAGLGGKKSPADLLRMIRAMKRAATSHWSDSLSAWREYEKAATNETSELRTEATDDPKVFPAYFAAAETLLPAFYARTPQLTTERAFEINDDIANTMALINQRLGKYFIRTSAFDETMKSSTAEFLHAAKGTNQVIYKAKTNPARKPLKKISEKSYVDETGAEYPGEVKLENGKYFGESQEVDQDSQKIELRPVSFDEILHTPNAKVFEDIQEIAIYFSITKEAAELDGSFPKEVLAAYPWKKGTSKDDGTEDKVRERLETSDCYMDGWEVWCKQSKTVYWVSESFPSDFLKEPKEDPYKLKGFFPIAPFILMSKPRKTLYPRPVYVQLRPTLEQVNTAYQRLFGLIDSSRPRAIVDGDENVDALLTAGDQTYVAVASTKGLVEKGGLQSLVQFLPVQEFVNAARELQQQIVLFDDNVSKWIGVPDILRGQTDPIEAVGTQEIKATAAHDRFKVYKKDVQQLARDSIEMMLDLAYGTFSDAKIAQIVGYDYMDPPDQARFPESLSRLRNDTERVIRIDIETDSMTFIDQGLKAQRRNLAIQSALNGIKEVAGMAESNPAMAMLALKAVLLGLEGLDDGKQYQDQIKTIGAEITEAAKNPPPQPAPPPDYEGAKVEILGREVQLKERELALKESTVPVQEQAKIDKSIAELELKAKELEIRAAEVESKAQVEQLKSELEALKAVAAQKAEQQWLELEKAKSLMSAHERTQEEERARTDQLLETVRLMQERMQENEGSEESEEMPGVSPRAPKKNQPHAPAIHVHIDGDSEYTSSRQPDGTLKIKKTRTPRSNMAEE